MNMMEQYHFRQWSMTYYQHFNSVASTRALSGVLRSVALKAWTFPERDGACILDECGPGLEVVSHSQMAPSNSFQTSSVTGTLSSIS